jgi:hypothetical protein
MLINIYGYYLSIPLRVSDAHGIFICVFFCVQSIYNCSSEFSHVILLIIGQLNDAKIKHKSPTSIPGVIMKDIHHGPIHQRGTYCVYTISRKLVLYTVTKVKWSGGRNTRVIDRNLYGAAIFKLGGSCVVQSAHTCERAGIP